MTRIGFLLCAAWTLHAADPSEPFYFSRIVYPLLQHADCRGCHSGDGVASTTRLRFPVESAGPEQVEEFGKRLRVLVDRKNVPESLLIRKPANRMPHGGGERIRSGGTEETVLLSWAKHLASSVPVGPESGPSASKAMRLGLRRLTHSQYNNTVRDLLGDQTQPAHRFPPEDFVDGFKNQAKTQAISPVLTEAYFAAAEKLARNAFRFGDTQGLIPCRPQSATDLACATQFVRKFGLGAFRRPLDGDEESEFASLLVKQAEREGDFKEGARIVVEAILQSPSFLFRIESASSPKRTQFETASMLSFSLWDTMPDAELLQAAGAGALGTPGDVETQVRRLLNSPLAHKAVNQFVEQWLRFDRLLSSVKDRRLFADYSPPLAVSMTEETRKLVDHLVWNKRNFMEVFSADYSFVNRELAQFYGLPPPAEPFGLVRYPAESERSGILGHGTFLAQTGKPEETSPTERGMFIREHFLCQAVSPPPPGVNATPPPFLVGSKPMTNRERLETLHLSDPSCAGCHRLVDPIGFGLERFDTVGKWHAKQKLTIFPTKDQRQNIKPQTFELDLNTRANILGIPDSGFASAKELGRVLAHDATCQKCVVRQWFRFVMGRHEAEEDRAMLDRVYEDFRRARFQFQEMMVSMLRLLSERRQQ